MLHKKGLVWFRLGNAYITVLDGGERGCHGFESSEGILTGGAGEFLAHRIYPRFLQAGGPFGGKRNIIFSHESLSANRGVDSWH